MTPRLTAVIVLFTFLLDEGLTITRLSSPRPARYEDAETDLPRPRRHWEEALRHSVYLTLIRDRIDAIVSSKDHRRYDDGDEDSDLWLEIRRAPFVTARTRRQGPIFGDIAILSRGRLVRLPSSTRLAFVEDEDIRECLGCDLYHSRRQGPNEIVEPRCSGPTCGAGDARALWTVRRIRHRNGDGTFRYELMFSIASAGGIRSDRLDYDAPTQTFTVSDATERRPVFTTEQVEPPLNIGEVYRYRDHSRGGKKYEDGDRVFEEIEPPAITHFHHHYYPRKEIPIGDYEASHDGPDPIVKPMTLQKALQFKPFRPSPEEVTSARYSEPDPLFTETPTTETPRSTTVKVIEEEIDPPRMETTTGANERSVKETKGKKNVAKKKAKALEERPTGRRKSERPLRKPTRRARVQKKYSETVNAQVPSPEGIKTTVPYNEQPLISQPEITDAEKQEGVTDSGSTTPVPRRKYQRKYGTWSKRRGKSKSTTKKEIDTFPTTNSDDTVRFVTEKYKTTPLTMTAPEESTTLNSINQPTEQGDNSTPDETATPHTKQSLVTSISLKLGNETRPYHPKNDTEINEMLGEVDLEDTKAATVSEVTNSDENVKIFKAEDARNDTSLISDHEIESLMEKLIKHAKSIDSAAVLSSDDSDN